jgi:hypothetical protein
MPGPTTIKSAASMVLVTVAVAILAVPAAFANSGLVDDWFRGPKLAPQSSIGLIDVTAPGVSRAIASPVASAPVTPRLIDDWFREAKARAAGERRSH